MNMRTLAILLIAGVGAGAVVPVLAQDAMSGTAAMTSSQHDAMKPGAMAPAAMQSTLSVRKHPAAMKNDARAPDAMMHGTMKPDAMQQPTVRMKPATTHAAGSGN
jgi:hypothetical protein